MMLAGSAEVASVTRMTHHGNTDEHSGSGRHPVQRVHRPHFNDVVSRVLSRRGFLKAGLGAGAVGFMGAGLTACGSDDDDDSPAKPTTPGKPTPEQPAGRPELQGRAREHGRHRRGARGLPVRRAQPLGRSAVRRRAAFKADASNGGADQARQIGYNHDGMHFFPIDGTDSATGSSVEGLMVTNHEYTTPEYFYPVGVVPGNASGTWTGCASRSTRMACRCCTSA